jgi:hypothetical protein
MMKKTHPTLQGETSMFRKMAFVLAATAALGAVALSPTSASAWGHGHWGGHGWGGHGWGWGGFGVGVAAGLVGGAIVANTCVQRRVIDTPYGPVVRWVNVCY